MVEAGQEQVPLDKNLFLFEDSSNQLTFRQLVACSSCYSFVESTEPVPVRGKHTFWARFSVSNPSANPWPVLLEVDYPYLDHAQAFVVVNNKLTKAFPDYSWQTPFSKRIYPHRNFIYPITLRGRQAYTIYLRMQRRTGSFRIHVRLWNAKAFELHNLNETGFWGLIVGWLLFATIFGFILFGINGGRLHLYYGLYALFQLGALITHEALAGDYYLQGQLGVPGYFMRNVFLILAVISNLLFIKSFVRSSEYVPPVLMKITNWVLYLMPGWVVWTVMSRILNVPLEISLKTAPLYFAHYLAIVMLCGVFITLGLLNKQYRRMAGLYLFAFSPILIMGGAHGLSNLGEFSNHAFLQMQTYACAVVFETFVLLVGLSFSFKKNRDEREQLLQKQRDMEQQAYMIALQSQQQERQRLARELHDGSGLELAVLKMRLSSVADTYNAHWLLSEIMIDIDRISSNLRSVSHSLVPADLDELGLVGSINQLLQNLRSVHPKLEINFVYDKADSVPNLLEQSLYHMIKELLTNAVRHSEATIIDVELFQEENALHITVADNGRGYELEQVDKLRGLGLRNLYASVEVLNGQFNVIPRQPGVAHQIVIPNLVRSNPVTK